MYSILLMVSERENCKSLYRYYFKQNSEGKNEIFVANTIEELETEISNLLKTTNKDDLRIIKNLTWSVKTSVDKDNVSLDSIEVEDSELNEGLLRLFGGSN